MKHDELERIKQIIRTLQPAAEIIECDYADADLDKIIYTEVFDFERTATSAGLDTWNRERPYGRAEKKTRKNAHHHHHEGSEVDEYGIQYFCVLSSSGF